MVQSNRKFRKGAGIDGMAKDNSHQGEIDRRTSEGEPTVGYGPPETGSQIAEGLARITRRSEG